MESKKELTLGQKRVGWNFNPSEDPQVRSYKKTFSEHIDRLELQREEASKEKMRTISRAQTLAEDTCMLSVKSIFQ